MPSFLLSSAHIRTHTCTRTHEHTHTCMHTHACMHTHTFRSFLDVPQLCGEFLDVWEPRFDRVGQEVEQGGLLVGRLCGAQLCQVVQIEPKRLLVPTTSVHVVTHHQNNLKRQKKKKKSSALDRKGSKDYI